MCNYIDNIMYLYHLYCCMHAYVYCIYVHMCMCYTCAAIMYETIYSWQFHIPEQKKKVGFSYKTHAIKRHFSFTFLHECIMKFHTKIMHFYYTKLVSNST